MTPQQEDNLKIVKAYHLSGKTELTFVDIQPVYAVMYAQAEELSLLSWFFNATEQERLDKFKPIYGLQSVSCGDWVARMLVDQQNQEPKQ